MELSEEELNTGTLSEVSLQLASSLIKTNGYVIFPKVLSSEIVEVLHREFMRMLELHIAATDPNRGTNRYQMHLPFEEPFISPEIITNPMILPLVEKLLGANVACNYFASDTPLPGADYQAVHSDTADLFPEAAIGLPPACLVLNIPLVDFTLENGPLEIWPGGSHLLSGSLDIQGLAPRLHSEKVLMQAGSLLLRDMRMWHRGTPNKSDHPRPNMALIYSRPWLKSFYPPISIARSIYDSLSEQAKNLFRLENIV